MNEVGIGHDMATINGYLPLYENIMNDKYSHAAEPMKFNAPAPLSVAQVPMNTKAKDLGYGSVLPMTDEQKVATFIAQEVAKTYALQGPEVAHGWYAHEGSLTAYFSLRARGDQPSTLDQFKNIWAKVALESSDFPMSIAGSAATWGNGSGLTSFFSCRSYKRQLLQLMYIFNMIPADMTKEEFGKFAYASTENYTAVLLKVAIKMKVVAVPGLSQEPELGAKAPGTKAAPIIAAALPPAPKVAAEESTFNDSIFYKGIELPKEVKNERNAGPYENKCVTCSERVINIVFLPCCHQCNCFTCARNLVDKNPICPVCRAEIKAMINPKIVKND